MDKPSDDLDQLRDRFPGWRISDVWISAANGPDRRRVYAIRGSVRLTAWSAAQLARHLEGAEASE